jgi:hypothetical protein
LTTNIFSGKQYNPRVDPNVIELTQFTPRPKSNSVSVSTQTDPSEVADNTGDEALEDIQFLWTPDGRRIRRPAGDFRPDHRITTGPYRPDVPGGTVGIYSPVDPETGEVVIDFDPDFLCNICYQRPAIEYQVCECIQEAAKRCMECLRQSILANHRNPAQNYRRCYTCRRTFFGVRYVYGPVDKPYLRHMRDTLGIWPILGLIILPLVVIEGIVGIAVHNQDARGGRATINLGGALVGIYYALLLGARIYSFVEFRQH